MAKMAEAHPVTKAATMLKSIASIAVYLAVTAEAVVSPSNLNSDLSILIQNDLRGIQSSTSLVASLHS